MSCRRGGRERYRRIKHRVTGEDTALAVGRRRLRVQIVGELPGRGVSVYAEARARAVFVLRARADEVPGRERQPSIAYRGAAVDRTDAVAGEAGRGQKEISQIDCETGRAPKQTPNVGRAAGFQALMKGATAVDVTLSRANQIALYDLIIEVYAKNVTSTVAHPAGRVRSPAS